MQGFEHAFFAGKLRLRRKMLPAEEPAHVDGWGDGLDLLAQRVEGAAVDTLKDAALAPLDVVIVLGRCVFEYAAHQEALHLHGEECLKDFAGIEGQALGEGIGSGGSEYLGPTLHALFEGCFFCN